MEELLFYTIDKNYIKYLSEFESHVSYNKDEIGHSRPYLGIVLKIINTSYHYIHIKNIIENIEITLVFSLYMIGKISH